MIAHGAAVARYDGGPVSSARPGGASRSRVIRGGDCAVRCWNNGLGKTTDVLREPDHDDWQWRVTVGEAEAVALLPEMPGVDRELVLLEGAGIRLRFPDGHLHHVRAPHGSVRLPGEQAVEAELVDGPCRDFSILWKRGAVNVSGWQRSLRGNLSLLVDQRETWLVHVVDGHCGFGGQATLEPPAAGDTAVLRAAAARTRFTLEGDARLLLFQVVQARDPHA